MAHTDPTMKRIENAHQVVDGDLQINSGRERPYTKSGRSKNEGNRDEACKSKLGSVENLVMELGAISYELGQFDQSKP